MSLDPGRLLQLHLPDDAAQLLLLKPLRRIKQPAVLLLDGLDAADLPGADADDGVAASCGAHPAEPVGGSRAALHNPVLRLVLTLSQLPPYVCLVVTTRPRPHILNCLRARFPAISELQPAELQQPGSVSGWLQQQLGRGGLPAKNQAAWAGALLDAGRGRGGLLYCSVTLYLLQVRSWYLLYCCTDAVLLCHGLNGVVCEQV